MDIYLTNNTFFDAKASYTTTIYANTPTVFVCEITSQTNKRGALIGPTNQQVVANTVCWFIEHPGLSCALQPILSRCCYLFLNSLTAALAIPSASTEEALEGVAVLNAPCQRHR
jgi:hypothetical protein